MSEAANPNYEENLARLQRVVERLERDALGLEESLSLFEEGMVLVGHCDQQLRQVEERVKVLVAGSQALNPRADLPMDPISIDNSKEQTDE